MRDFGLKHVSSGDLLRQNINEGTPIGKEAKAFMDKGELVPDEVMVNLISTELKKLGEQSWLLDGFPRTQPQAAALQKETPVNVVVNLDVPFETIIDRVKGNAFSFSQIEFRIFTTAEFQTDGFILDPDVFTTQFSILQKSLEKMMKLEKT